MLQAFKIIWDFSGKEKSTINKSLIFVMINAFFQLFRVWAIYMVVTAIARGESGMNIAVNSLIFLAISVAGVAVTQTFYQLMQTHAGFFMVANERIDIADKLKTIPMGFFSKLSQGRIVGIATTVLGNVETGAPIVLVQLVGAFVGTIALTIMIFFFDFRIGFIVLAAVIAFLLILTAMERRSRSISPRRQESETKLVSEFMEHIQGISVVKAFNLTGKGDKKVRAAIEDNRVQNQRLEALVSPFTALQSIALQVGGIAIMISAALLYIDGLMDIERAIISIIMSFLVFSKTEVAGISMSLLRMTSSSIIQAREIDEYPSIGIEGKDLSPESHDVVFNDVHFSYDISENGTKDTNEVIKGVSFTVPDKSSLAIVGYSGSGKSTLASLIGRFWDVNDGSISVGGVDVRDYSLEALMNQMSFVFQDVYLFEDTIENNIKFGIPNATHEQVREAARKASCLEFIDKLPDGFDTMIGEGGQTLSGGEKQRISIARAMLKDAPIIILDEATASVDPENEDKLIAAIEALTHQKTVIMIAHRLKTVRNADNIIVLKEGNIIEEGKHEELVKLNGVYERFIAGRQEAAGWKL